jgi:DNA-binding NtrC family response regulator
MENLIDELLDGRILLNEAVAEFEKIFIEKALERNNEHLSNTAEALGIHRNTLSKRVTEYKAAPKPRPLNAKTKKPRGKVPAKPISKPKKR